MAGKQSTPPFKSKLVPFEKEIIVAWDQGKTLKEIQSFLLENNIEITLPSIHSFIKCRIKKLNPHRVPRHIMEAYTNATGSTSSVSSKSQDRKEKASKAASIPAGSPNKQTTDKKELTAEKKAKKTVDLDTLIEKVNNMDMEEWYRQEEEKTKRTSQYF